MKPLDQFTSCYIGRKLYQENERLGDLVWLAGDRAKRSKQYIQRSLPAVQKCVDKVQANVYAPKGWFLELCLRTVVILPLKPTFPKDDPCEEVQASARESLLLQLCLNVNLVPVQLIVREISVKELADEKCYDPEEQLIPDKAAGRGTLKYTDSDTADCSPRPLPLPQQAKKSSSCTISQSSDVKIISQPRHRFPPPSSGHSLGRKKATACRYDNTVSASKLQDATSETALEKVFSCSTSLLSGDECQQVISLPYKPLVPHTDISGTAQVQQQQLFPSSFRLSSEVASEVDGTGMFRISRQVEDSCSSAKFHSEDVHQNLKEFPQESCDQSVHGQTPGNCSLKVNTQSCNNQLLLRNTDEEKINSQSSSLGTARQQGDLRILRESKEALVPESTENRVLIRGHYVKMDSTEPIHFSVFVHKDGYNALCGSYVRDMLTRDKRLRWKFGQVVEGGKLSQL